MRAVSQPTGARRTGAEQVVVGSSQRVIDGADEVLALALVERQDWQEADEIRA